MLQNKSKNMTSSQKSKDSEESKQNKIKKS